MGEGPEGHAPSIGRRAARLRGPVVPDRPGTMGPDRVLRTTSDAPDRPARSGPPCPDQSPVPAASVIAARTAAWNSGAHGPALGDDERRRLDRLEGLRVGRVGRGRRRRRSGGAARSSRGCGRCRCRCGSASPGRGPAASSPIAVCSSSMSSQPASPETMWSIRSPRLTRSAGDPLEVGGVGAGGLAVRPQPATPTRSAISRTARPTADASERRRSGGGGHRSEATIGRLAAPAVEVSRRGPGAWPREAGRACRRLVRGGRSGAAAGAGGAGAGAGAARGPTGAGAGGLGVGVVDAVAGAGVAAARLGSRPAAAASLVAATSPRSIAARADEPAARSRAASIPATSTGRGATAARRRQPPASQRRASASSRRPIDTRRSAMSSGQRRRARISSVGQRSVYASVVSRSWVQGWIGRLDRAPAGRRPERGEERLVRPEQAVLGGRRRDEAERPPERRRAGPRLRHPDDVRPGVDLAERSPRRRPARSATSPTALDVRSGAVIATAGRVEVARRAVLGDALDPELGGGALGDERRLDAAGLLARERPANELAEELREPVPGDPAAWPSGQSSRTSRRPTGPARTATGRGAGRRAP